MTDIVLNFLVGIISGISGSIVTQIFYKSNKEKESKEERKDRRYRILEGVYADLRKYLNSLPIIAPKDILNKIVGVEYYPDMNIYETRDLLNEILQANLKTEEAEEDIKHLKKLMNELDVIEKKHISSGELYLNFYRNSANNLEHYSSKEVKCLLTQLLCLTREAFEKGSVAYIKLGSKDDISNNLFVKTLMKLNKEINKDLDSYG